MCIFSSHPEPPPSMAALEVGPMGAVQGRLPHGWRIAASFDRATGIVKITSPDTDRFLKSDAKITPYFCARLSDGQRKSVAAL